MFQTDPFFAQRNTNTGLMEWFFNSREGVQGPYPSKQGAIKGRVAYSAFCRERGISNRPKMDQVASITA
jgi:hypothetical protein